MLVEEELVQFSPEKGMLLTIGVFDGVHLGHQYLISQLREQAKKQDLISGVVTFRQHPREVLSPQTKLPFLTDLTQRTRLLENEGVDAIITLSFTRDLAQISPRQFISLLQKHLKMRGLVIGPDFALGRRREGNVNTLHALGQEMGFTIAVVPPLTINDEVTSSTAIRQALAEGDMEKVHNLAGRPFSLSKRVIAGTGRGAELGFPTANLDINAEQALPPDGVYATWAHIDEKTYPSMTYIGKQPTFGGKQRTVEVFIIDHNCDLYGHELKIDLIERLRGDKQFNTVEELKEQITRDIKQGAALLNPVIRAAPENRGESEK